MIAILVHALMPSPGATMNTEDFDSLLVKTFGFPVVASSYFIILYLHICIVVRYFGARSSLEPKKIGLRFGAAFALIYFMGMQEVVVEGSPFSSWGADFVMYQLFMGLGDAVPALLLCAIIAVFILEKKQGENKQPLRRMKHNVLIIGAIAAAFFTSRMLGYMIGYIGSDMKRYPIPVMLWTIIFGLVLGISYILLRPIYDHETSVSDWNITVMTLGINWIIFNSFIGMILAGTMIQMLIRSGVDVAAVYLVTLFLEKRVRVNKEETVS